jgi:type III pantothenate kinase
VVICGGNSGFFEKSLKMDIFVASNLVLSGLNNILLYKQSLHA